MSIINRTRIANTLLIALLLGSPKAHAAEVDPKALAALEQMGVYLRSLQQFRIDAQSHTDQVLESGQVVEFSHQTRLLAVQPDKLHVWVESGGERRSLFYNGQRFTLYDSRTGYFADKDAPGNIAGLLDRLSEHYGIELPLADLFRWGPDTAKAVGITDALVIGTDTVGSKVCTHYAYRQSDIDWQLWIRQGPQSLPCRLVISRRDSAGQPRHSINYHWQLNRPPVAKDFEFTPPAGARAVPLQQLVPQGEQP